MVGTPPPLKNLRTIYIGNSVVRDCSCYAALSFWYASRTNAFPSLENEGKLSLKHTNNIHGNSLSIAKQLLFLNEGRKQKKIHTEAVAKPDKPLGCLSKCSQFPFQGWWKSNIELKMSICIWSLLINQNQHRQVGSFQLLFCEEILILAGSQTRFETAKTLHPEN